MEEAVTIAAVAKKVLEILASSKKGRSFLGYVLGIAIFLVLLPVIVLYGLFGWMTGDGGTLNLRNELLNNLPVEDVQVIEQINTTCDTIKAVFEIKGLSMTDERKAEAIYLTCLVGREDEENFHNSLADCFLYADADVSVFDLLEMTFGVTVSPQDREAIDKIE